MRTFTMSATNFYFMNRGEKLTSHQQFAASIMYVIWPRGKKWDLRYKRHNGWEEIHSGLFESENEAFLLHISTLLIQEKHIILTVDQFVTTSRLNFHGMTFFAAKPPKKLKPTLPG